MFALSKADRATHNKALYSIWLENHLAQHLAGNQQKHDVKISALLWKEYRTTERASRHIGRRTPQPESFCLALTELLKSVIIAFIELSKSTSSSHYEIFSSQPILEIFLSASVPHRMKEIFLSKADPCPDEKYSHLGRSLTSRQLRFTFWNPVRGARRGGGYAHLLHEGSAPGGAVCLQPLQDLQLLQDVQTVENVQLVHLYKMFKLHKCNHSKNSSSISHLKERTLNTLFPHSLHIFGSDVALARTLPTPRSLGANPIFCTSCWNGWYCKYATVPIFTRYAQQGNLGNVICRRNKTTPLHTLLLF